MMRVVLPESSDPSGILAFPPNRQTMGGTAYWIRHPEGNLLVDCPAWDGATQAFLQEQGGVRWLFLTHRGAIAQVSQLQKTLACEVVIQEQEAYLLPGVSLTTFQHRHDLTPDLQTIWTPGHSPGSACLYFQQFGGVLFTGRHLLPDPQGHLAPIRTAKTFHWGRQLGSVEQLIQQFTPDTLQWICPAANTGFLRGKYAIADAYQHLVNGSGGLGLPGRD